MDKARLIKGVEKKRLLLKRIIRAVSELPDDLPVTQIWESCESICLDVPYDPRRVAQVRGALGSDWRLLEKPQTTNDGDWVVHYCLKRDPRVKITLFGSILEEGATCRRVPVGTRMETIYQIVCDKGGKE